MFFLEDSKYQDKEALKNVTPLIIHDLTEE